MGSLTKGFLGALLGTAVILPYSMSSGGWGLGSERNSVVMKQSGEYCPPGRVDSVTGRCLGRARSYYYGHRSRRYGRSYVGGGPRFGK